MKTIAIVTYDWLEGETSPTDKGINLLTLRYSDSIMKGYRHAAKGEYLVGCALEATKKAKQEKKMARNAIIQKGSQYPPL